MSKKIDEESCSDVVHDDLDVENVPPELRERYHRVRAEISHQLHHQIQPPMEDDNVSNTSVVNVGN